MDARYLRSALFVDFDNIYSGLDRASREAAQRFAQDPSRWIRWLEELPLPAEDGRFRRLLVRRCYLNPHRYNAYRPYLLRAAFEVVDCPPLTSLGKTSADMRMVLDIVDTLNHPTRFDEFILLSGDADFTPLLLRLRKHDRRTAVLSVGPAAGAYRAASDLLLPEERFLEEALGIADAEPRPAVPPPAAPGDRASGELLAAIARRLEEAAGLSGCLEPWTLPAFYKEFPEFSRREDWLGYHSLRALTEAVVATHKGLVLREDEDWRVEVHGDDQGGDDRAGSVDRQEVAAFVRRQVADAEEPVVLATLAHQVQDRFGDALREGRWQGAGSFRGFLETLDLGEVEVSGAVPGHVYLPERHGEVRRGEERDRFAEADPELAELARRIHDLTDTPYLPPAHYAVLLTEIARQVNTDGFQLTRTSKAVRDRVNGKGISVARSDVGFLLKGLTFSGYELCPGEETARSIGRQVALNTVQLARRAQVELDEQAERKVREWILGGLPGADQPPGEAEEAAETGGEAAGEAADAVGSAGSAAR